MIPLTTDKPPQKHMANPETAIEKIKRLKAELDQSLDAGCAEYAETLEKVVNGYVDLKEIGSLKIWDDSKLASILDRLDLVPKSSTPDKVPSKVPSKGAAVTVGTSKSPATTLSPGGVILLKYLGKTPDAEFRTDDFVKSGIASFANAKKNLDDLKFIKLIRKEGDRNNVKVYGLTDEGKAKLEEVNAAEAAEAAAAAQKAAK